MTRLLGWPDSVPKPPERNHFIRIDNARIEDMAGVFPFQRQQNCGQVPYGPGILNLRVVPRDPARLVQFPSIISADYCWQDDGGEHENFLPYVLMFQLDRLQATSVRVGALWLDIKEINALAAWHFRYLAQWYDEVGPQLLDWMRPQGTRVSGAPTPIQGMTQEEGQVRGTAGRNGNPGLSREEWITRLALALEAEDIKANNSRKKWAQIAREIGWVYGGDTESKLHLLKNARDKLVRLRHNDPAGLLTEAMQRKSAKETKET